MSWLGSGPTRAHWVSDSLVDVCYHPDCHHPCTRGQRHHCRRCGLVLCDRHSTRVMRLDAHAQPVSAWPDEATGDSWLVRVCDVCHESNDDSARSDSSEPGNLQFMASGRKSTRSRRSLKPITGVADDAPLTRDLTSHFRSRHYRAARDRGRHVIDVYLRLCEEPRPGVPPLQSATLVRWLGSDACSLCSRAFHTLLRRHHCRLCGTSACDG